MDVPWHGLPIDAVASRLSTDVQRGLEQAAADGRRPAMLRKGCVEPSDVEVEMPPARVIPFDSERRRMTVMRRRGRRDP
jgi:magnesium-transporting ATPase (P-type)